MRLPVATLRLDVMLQARSRLYAIGVGVAALLGLLGRVLFEPRHAGSVLPALYLLGLGGTTYVFGAAVVLFEKSEDTLRALRVSPLGAGGYLTSKVVTLTAFATLESAIVYAVAFAGVPMRVGPMLLGVVALGVVYTLVGLGQVARHDTVTDFLLPGALVVGTLLQLPVFYVLGVGPPLLWYFVPTQGPLLLMIGAFEPLTTGQWVYAVTMSAAAVAASAVWARVRFRRWVGLPER